MELTHPRTPPPETSGKRGRGSGDGVDRLSTLPDALLHSVMSYLTELQAVRTRALSRRWRHQWRSAPCVDVNSDMFETSKPGAEPPLQAFRKMRWEKLDDFVTNLLRLHSAPTMKFTCSTISTAELLWAPENKS